MGESKNGIGTLRERSLHADLKQWCFRPGDLIEEMVDGYHIDIKRGPLLIEIQTRNFSAIKAKLRKLLDAHPVLLVHPIAKRKWIAKQNKRGKAIGRRRSPKRGRIEDLFQELIRIPQLASHPNFSLEIAFIEEEEVWRDDGKGSWRRGKWSIHDRRLLKVLDSQQFSSGQDFLDLLPPSLDKRFTNKALATAQKISPSLAGKMSYSLRKMGLLEIVGKDGNANIFEAKAVDTI